MLLAAQPPAEKRSRGSPDSGVGAPSERPRSVKGKCLEQRDHPPGQTQLSRRRSQQASADSEHRERDSECNNRHAIHLLPTGMRRAVQRAKSTQSSDFADPCLPAWSWGGERPDDDG